MSLEIQFLNHCLHHYLSFSLHENLISRVLFCALLWPVKFYLQYPSGIENVLTLLVLIKQMYLLLFVLLGPYVAIFCKISICLLSESIFLTTSGNCCSSNKCCFTSLNFPSLNIWSLLTWSHLRVLNFKLLIFWSLMFEC